MSDQWGPTDDEHTGSGAQQPPPPPPPPSGQAPLEPTLILESESEVTRSGGISGRVVAGLVGALLLVGGTVFAASQLGSSGPGSPEAAVSELLDAASDEDVLGLLAALDPGERDALRGPVQDLFDELERLEVVDSSFELDGVGGIDLAFEDVTFRTEPVRDDLARVYFTGGTVTTNFDSDEVPIGDFVSDTLDRFGADISGVQESDTSDITDTDTFIVARNGSDGWRVSIGYTAAEAARLGMGASLPEDPIVPIGSDSPEAAVEGLLHAATDLDLGAVIAHLSPNELGPLQDYAGLFLGDARSLASSVEDFDLTIDSLDLTSETSGDRAEVFIEGFDVTYTGDSGSLSVSYADECVSIDGDLEEFPFEETPFGDGPVCLDEFEDLMGEFNGRGWSDDEEFELEIPTMPEMPSVDAAETGITTARVDGDWYVAPVSTGLDTLVSGLEVLERSHLDAMVDYFEAMMNSFEEAFTVGESFEETGDRIGGNSFDPEFEDPIGAPTTTMPAEAVGEVDEAALEEFVHLAADDADHADCMLAELELEDPYVRYELADSYVYDYVPSQGTQDAFIGLLEYCQGL